MNAKNNTTPASFIDIVFDGPPGPECGRFVECEDSKRASISIGEWVKRDDGYDVLRIPVAVPQGHMMDDAGRLWGVKRSVPVSTHYAQTFGIDDGQILLSLIPPYRGAYPRPMMGEVPERFAETPRPVKDRLQQLLNEDAGKNKPFVAASVEDAFRQAYAGTFVGIDLAEAERRTFAQFVPTAIERFFINRARATLSLDIAKTVLLSEQKAMMAALSGYIRHVYGDTFYHTDAAAAAAVARAEVWADGGTHEMNFGAVLTTLMALVDQVGTKQEPAPQPWGNDAITIEPFAEHLTDSGGTVWKIDQIVHHKNLNDGMIRKTLRLSLGANDQNKVGVKD